MNSGADRRAGQQSGADDSGPQRSAARLGSVGAERHAARPASPARYELPFGRGKRWLAVTAAQTDRRLAAECDRDAAERLPVHAAGRLEPLRRRRHAQSRPAFAESVVHRTGRAGQSESVVQSECVRSADGGHLRESGPRDPDRARVWPMWICRCSRTLALAERASCSSAPSSSTLLNHANFGTPNAIVFSNGAPSSTAGLITTTATTSRQIQFGLKLIF